MNHSHDKPTLPARCCILLVRSYQAVLSPLMAGHCRFHPTCSCYAIESYRIHGALRGTWLTLKRLLKCHPFSRHAGFDPVPPGDESEPRINTDEKDG